MSAVAKIRRNRLLQKMWSFFGGQSPLEPAMVRLHGITNAVYEMCLRNKPFLCISTKHQLLIIGILFFLVLFGHEPLDKFVDVDLMVKLFSFFLSVPVISVFCNPPKSCLDISHKTKDVSVLVVKDEESGGLPKTL